MKVLLIVGFGSKGPLSLIEWFTWGLTLLGLTDHKGKKAVRSQSEASNLEERKNRRLGRSQQA